MIIVLLCGGAGTRFDNYFPKPLNLVYGSPMIHYVIRTLENKGIKDLKIIHHIDLESYGFKQYLINTFGNISFQFYPIPFQTRGPAETVYLGLKNFENKEEQVLLLDNDNIYSDLNLDNIPSGNFILYTKNPTGLHHYSFIKVDDDKNILHIAEREPISDYICVGGYGFKNIQNCIQICKKTVLETADEPYMSLAIQNLLKSGEKVKGIYLENCFSIGTPSDVLLNKHKLSRPKLKFVLDLDNTLVTYPNNYKDYSTVEKMNFLTNFIKKLKSEGHYIIINTARNMVTSGNNPGKVMKNVGLTTLTNLKELGIEYDEIHFGKPYGDIYIDDKAFNTFDLSLFQQIGFYDSENSLISFNCNRYNKIVRTGKNSIVKFGNNISSEIFYYKQIVSNPVSRLFPKFIQHSSEDSVTLEYINGTNLNKIYSEGLLQQELFQNFMNEVKNLHSTSIEDEVKLSSEDIYSHYLVKFEERSKKIEDYPFQDFEDVYTKIKKNLSEFFDHLPNLNPIIHGDLWFSNVMYYKKNFVIFDMRGKFNDIQTIKGHTIYDYSKIYQSIVGLDHIINYNENIPKSIREPIEKIFWENYPHDIFTLKRMTGYLIYCTFHAYEPGFEISKKEKIWNLVKSLII
jgi:dTDP-glucose pyrophosphorylase